MLHHVFPGGGMGDGFSPNRVLEVTPEFLDRVIAMVKQQGFDLVDMDEAIRRMDGGGRAFAVFTLDDGYRDNLVHARPVFDRHSCPYTVYVAPAIIDGTCELWWRGLEQVLARCPAVEAEIAGERLAFLIGGDRDRNRAWCRIYPLVRRMEQHAQRRWIREFCGRHGVDLDAMCRAAAMTWDEVRAMARDPLCTIGAHTINHYAISALDEQEALAEMAGSADRIERETGRRPRHFAFPYGDPDSAGPRDFELARRAGFASALTTRKGLIRRSHAAGLMSLPRLSLAGGYQNLRYVRTLMTGVPFALLKALRAARLA
jgi:peptidoglycan/xylan/chitin deacetylase (PgdA/CDA1 family)